MSSRLKLSLFEQSVSKQRIRIESPATACRRCWKYLESGENVEDRCTIPVQFWVRNENGELMKTSFEWQTDIDCPLCVRNDPIHSCHSYKSSLDSQFSAIAYYNFIQFNIQRFILRKRRLMETLQSSIYVQKKDR